MKVFKALILLTIDVSVSSVTLESPHPTLQQSSLPLSGHTSVPDLESLTLDSAHYLTARQLNVTSFCTTVLSSAITLLTRTLLVKLPWLGGVGEVNDSSVKYSTSVHRTIVLISQLIEHTNYLMVSYCQNQHVEDKQVSRVHSDNTTSTFTLSYSFVYIYTCTVCQLCSVQCNLVITQMLLLLLFSL